MRKLLFVTLFLIYDVCAAQVPHQIGGFILNTDVNSYVDHIKNETTLPIRFMEYLEEVEIKNTPGFKSGYIAYGNCDVPGRVARIKLKYADSSKNHYKKLLQAYTARFGEPHQWQGDPFHVVLAWKWSFIENGNQVDLFLQHNLMNDEKKLGNSVKLTMTNLVDKEQRCFAAKYPNFRKSDQQTTLEASVAWDDLVPK